MTDTDRPRAFTSLQTSELIAWSRLARHRGMRVGLPEPGPSAAVQVVQIYPRWAEEPTWTLHVPTGRDAVVLDDNDFARRTEHPTIDEALAAIIAEVDADAMLR